jgi:putative hydrolase of the HAD superfamily
MDDRGRNQKRTSAREYKAILFDVDGTLYRLRPLERAVQVHFLRGHWHQPRKVWQTHRAVSACRHATNLLREVTNDDRDLRDRQIEIAARACALPEKFVHECMRRWMEEEPLPYLREFRFEGVPEVLREFRERGLRLGVFSDFPAQAKLKALGIERFFEVVLSAHDAGVQRFKPDPRGLHVLLEQLGVQVEDAIYVGDRPSIDGVAAERAGMDFLIAGDGHRGRLDTFWRLREILLPENSQ